MFATCTNDTPPGGRLNEHSTCEVNDADFIRLNARCLLTQTSRLMMRIFHADYGGLRRQPLCISKFCPRAKLFRMLACESSLWVRVGLLGGNEMCCHSAMYTTTTYTVPFSSSCLCQDRYTHLKFERQPDKSPVVCHMATSPKLAHFSSKTMTLFTVRATS